MSRKAALLLAGVGVGCLVVGFLAGLSMGQPAVAETPTPAVTAPATAMWEYGILKDGFSFNERAIRWFTADQVCAGANLGNIYANLGGKTVPPRSYTGIADVLTLLGGQGWELVAVEKEYEKGVTDFTNYLMKRPARANRPNP